MSVRWGMVSTAAIGRVVVGASRGSKQAGFVAVAARDAGKAAACAADLVTQKVPEVIARIMLAMAATR